MPRKRKVHDDFWENFEEKCAATGLHSKVPVCMKELLTLCGYNSTWSFKSLTEDELSSLENYIEQHHREKADEFAEYANVKPFTFLPGHKSLILGIKLEIDEVQENKKPKKTKKQNANLNESDVLTSLLYQMSSYTKNLDLQADWTNAINDSSFTSNDNSLIGLCSVTCPICFTKYTVRYDKYWRNSNICRHVRKHIQLDNEQEDINADLVTNILNNGNDVLEVEVFQDEE